MKHSVQEIPQLLRNKGWGLYPRPPGARLTVEQVIGNGPAKGLTSGHLYDLLPLVSTKKELDQIFEGEEFFPKFVVPEGILPHEARSVAVFSGDEEEFSWPPGEEIIWTGLEFVEGEVRLFTPHATKTFMSLNAFLRALESMPDITSRLPKPKRTRRSRGAVKTT